MTPPKGLMWAILMLFFMLLEIGVLIDIERRYINATMLLLFASLGVLALLQLVGILLVAAGLYRVGGVLQVAASAVHALDLIGIIGVVGGIKAYRYPERLAISRPGAPSARETSIGQGLASPNQPDKARITTCQAGLKPDSRSGARSATPVGNRGEPSGESRSMHVRWPSLWHHNCDRTPSWGMSVQPGNPR